MQEQNEALLRQLHQREGAVRDLMAAAGATAAEIGAAVGGINGRRAMPPAAAPRAPKRASWSQSLSRACRKASNEG